MKNNVSGIYLIVNEVTGCVYVGSSSQIKERWQYHRARLRAVCHPNKYMQCSWKKHGESSFMFVVIEECAVEVLTAREQWWLNSFVQTGQVYNREMLISAAPRGQATASRQILQYSMPQLVFLKAESSRLGITVAELVRRIIDEYREKRG